MLTDGIRMIVGAHSVNGCNKCLYNNNRADKKMLGYNQKTGRKMYVTVQTRNCFNKHIEGISCCF